MNDFNVKDFIEKTVHDFNVTDFIEKTLNSFNVTDFVEKTLNDSSVADSFEEQDSLIWCMACEAVQPLRRTALRQD